MSYSARSSVTAQQTNTQLVAAPGAGKAIAVSGIYASADAQVTVYVADGPVSHILTIDIGAASGGNWTLTVDGNTSGNIAYNANAATVKSAIEGITGVTTVNVTGVGSTGDPWIVHFVDPIGALTITGSGAGLTPSDTLTVSDEAAGTILWRTHLPLDGQVGYGGGDGELFHTSANTRLAYSTSGAAGLFLHVNCDIISAGFAR